MSHLRALSTDNPDPHEDANYIIALAEAIKAERAVVAMKEQHHD